MPGLKLSDLSQLAQANLNDSDLVYIVSNGVSYGFLVSDLKAYIGQASLSGTASYIPVFTGGTAAGDSVIRQLSNNVGIGDNTPSEKLSVNGSVALTHQTAPGATTGVGKIYVKSDGKLYFKDESGIETNLLVSSVGSGVTDRYASVTAMIADQGNQVNKGIYKVDDDENSPSGYAYYEYNGTTNVNLSDYTLIASENAGGGGTWGSITGTLSDQTDLQGELDDKADKATGHTTGNIAELDASGNAVDSGIDGDPIDLYDVPSDVKAYLENDANWTGDTLTVTGFSENGDKGQRYVSTVTGYTYEVVDEPSVWARYPLNLSTVNIITMTAAEKTKLETSGNWNGVEWKTASNGGEDLSTDSTGKVHYDGTYFYWVIDNNFAIRLTRA